MRAKYVFQILVCTAIFFNWSKAQQNAPFTQDWEYNGRIVVQFSEAILPITVDNASGIARIGNSGLDELAQRYGVHQIRKLFPIRKPAKNSYAEELSRYYLLHFPPQINLREIIAAYQSNSAVISAESYGVYRVLYVPNDPMYGSQWALSHIGAETAFDYCRGSDEVIVGCVDVGIDTAHEDLRSNLWINPGENLNGNGIVDLLEWNAFDDDNNGFVDDFWGWNMWQNNFNVQEIYPSEGHGTFVSGCASTQSDNGIGIASLGYEVEIMTLKAGDGVYIFEGPESVLYCIENGANVVNLSWGAPIYYQYFQAIISYGWNEGLIFTAAAGSDGGIYPVYPAAYEHVLGVGSTDNSDHLTFWTNTGDWVDLYAPGVNILSTMPGSNYTMWSGTSGSTPQVAGLACLIWAADPTLTNDEIVNHIMNTSVNIDSLNPGHSGLLRIDAGAALAGLFLGIELTPENPPIVIPANGGSFGYNIRGSNNDDIPHTFD